jgi:hypothetical protein
MATPSFRVETGTTKYRICSLDGHEGPIAEYGDLATLVIGTAIYYCLIQEPDEEQPAVLRVDQAAEMTTEYEDVTFEGDEDEEDDAPLVGDVEEDEEEEDEEGVEVQ